MAVVVFRVRAWVRRRWRAGLVVGTLVGVIAGLVIGLASGARRTASAPDRYTAAVGGEVDLGVFQTGGAPLTEQVRAIDGVREVRALTFVSVFPLSATDTPYIDPEPWTGDDRIWGARVVEGRFTNPDAPDEFTANAGFMELTGARVGDRFQMVALDQMQTDANAFDSAPAVPPFSAVLVGVTEAPGDFDDPSPTYVLSSGFLAAHPDVGVVWTAFAIYLEPGASADEVLQQVYETPGGGGFYPTPERIVTDDARRAVRFQAVALWLVTAIAIIVAAVVAAQIVGRLLSVRDEEDRSLAALGWGRGEMALERGAEAALIAVVAWIVAIVIALAVSGLFPFGALRAFEPEFGRRLDWVVIGIGLAAVLVILVVVGVGSVRRGAHRKPAEVPPGRLDDVVAGTGAGVSLAMGAHFAAGANGRGRAIGSVALGAICLAGLVGSVVVGLTLAGAVDDPARWGVNYDLLIGNPFIPATTDIVTPVADDPDVTALTASTDGSLTIDGQEVAGVFAFEPVRGDILPVMLSGRVPSLVDEIALGAEVARRLRVGVGDTVTAEGSEGAGAELRVVGVVVTPGEAGNGAAMTFDAYAALDPSATKNVVLLRFRNGIPADAAQRFAAVGFTPPSPGGAKPTSVRALDRVVPAPFVLTLLLAALLGTACAYGLTMSVRARRHDLAVLRALGCERRQLRAMVHWQASLLGVVLLVFGLPAGVVLGRWVVSLLTGALGIVPGATVPLVLLVGIPVFVLLTANLLAWMPGRSAARTRTVELLRDR